jgi:DNA ligase-1
MNTKFATIYKKTKGGKTQEWTVEVENNKYRTCSGQLDGKKQTSEWTVCEGKNLGRTNETSPNDQALKEAEALRKKKLEGGYFEDVADIGQKKFFEPMLAEKWEDRKDEIVYPIYSQPKLDGIRCIVKADGMWTRAGKQIISAPHIFESLKPYFIREPNLIFDGELYCDKLSDNFNKIVSLVKKTKPTEQDLKESKETIQYWIYDLPSTDDVFRIRIGDVLTLLYKSDINFPDCCKVVTTDVVVNEAAVTRLYGTYIDNGFEGQMLRTNSRYENKRSKTLLKHKTFQDEEFTILDIVEGEGNRTGAAGYMVFERDGKRFKSNIKGTWEYLVDTLARRDTLIGKTATVKYFNLTPDGIPRFPYVINVDRESYEG